MSIFLFFPKTKLSSVNLYQRIGHDEIWSVSKFVFNLTGSR